MIIEEFALKTLAVDRGWTVEQYKEKLEKRITPAEAGRIVGVSTETIRSWIHHGKLDAWRIQGWFWINPDDLVPFR